MISKLMGDVALHSGVGAKVQPGEVGPCKLLGIVLETRILVMVAD